MRIHLAKKNRDTIFLAQGNMSALFYGHGNMSRNWNLQLHPQIYLIDQLLSSLKNRLIVMINNVVFNNMMLDKSAMFIERNG